MNLLKVGRSGLQVSAIGLGCNNFGMRIDLEGSRRVVGKALDSGITFFDTADVYGHLGGSESYLGQILGNRRKDIVLATKFGFPMDEARTLKGASRRYIMSAVEASLRRLNTTWIDLYQLHGPDPATPIEETLRALDDLVRQGKVLYIGCSNFAAWQVVESRWTARETGTTAFISAQNEYSLLVRGPEAELIPAVEAYGLGFLPYFPLASGMLTGKYRRDRPLPEDSRFATWERMGERYLNERNWEILEGLERFCASRGHTVLELAFSWLLSKPVVSSVIAGATRPEQIEQNVTAGDWVLSVEDLAETDRILKG